MKDLDIVVYGATGFTGRLCVDYLAQYEARLNGPLPAAQWRQAGRGQSKRAVPMSKL